MKLSGLFTGVGFAGFVSFKIAKEAEYKATIAQCYATSENFPDTGVKDLLTALQNAFGFRFMYDSEGGSVSCLFVDEWLKQEQTPIELNAKLVGEPIKQDHGIDGYKLSYSGTDDDEYFTYYRDGEKIKVPKKVLKNGRYNYEGDADDAHYNYKTFIDEEDGRATISTKRYGDYADQYVTENNKRVMIDQETGKAYVVRIDEDSEKASEGLRKAPNPSIFEVGEFIPVEYGKCDNEDRRKDVDISFTPVIMTNIGSPEDPIYGLMIEDGEWRRPSRVKFEIPMSVTKYNEVDSVFKELWNITYQMFSGLIYINREGQYGTVAIQESTRYCNFRLTTFLNFIAWLNYDMGGECPIYTNDMGFSLGIMRGGGKSNGSTEEIVVTKRDADGFGNAYINSVQTHGYAEFHSDTIDDNCRVWDYNGNESGITSLSSDEQMAIVTLRNVVGSLKWALKGRNVELEQIMFRYSYLDILESPGWKRELNRSEYLVPDESDESDESEGEMERALGTFYTGVPCIEVPIFIYDREVKVYLSIVKETGIILTPTDIRGYAEVLEERFAELSMDEQSMCVVGSGLYDYVDEYMKVFDYEHLYVCCGFDTTAISVLRDVDNLWFGDESVMIAKNSVIHKAIPVPNEFVPYVNYVLSNSYLMHTWAEMAAAGWSCIDESDESEGDTDGDTSDTVVALTTTPVSNIGFHIFKIANTDGTLVTKSEFDEYIAAMNEYLEVFISSEAKRAAMKAWDASHKALLLCEDAVFNNAAGDYRRWHFYPLLRYLKLYYTNNAVQVQDVTEEDLKGRISLYIKAEKPKSDENGKRTGEYFEARGVGAGKRGLFDKFHASLAYFLTHCKETTLPVELSLQEYQSIDMTKMYTVCGVTGYIKETSVKYTDNGMTGVEITLLYL